MLAASVSFIALTGTAAAVESFEEIVVTATRRAESLQDVSASVSALTNFDLQRQGLDNFEGLARSIPGLTMTQPVKNRAVFNIRGIATTVTGSNTQDPVSVYVNDTPVTDTYGAIVQPDLRLFDIERVEVLRGPQGTLFGSGSLGGTVRIITNKPRADATEVAGRIDLGVSDGGAFRQRYDLMLNTPIIEDKLALRFVGYYRDEEGWVENVNLGTRNDTVDWGGRLAAQWTPNSDLTVRLEIIHQESDPEDGDGWNPAIGKFKSSSAIPLPRPSNLTNYSLTVDYGVDGFADLTSISTYQRSVSASLGDAGDAFGVGLPLLSLSDPWASKFYTQEFRIVSNTDSRFDWLFGAFFVDRETNVDFLLQVPGLRDWSGGTIPTDDYFVSRITTKSQELAGYGDFGYRFLDNWRISAGLRVFRTKVSYEEPDRRVLNFSTFEIDRSSLLNKGKDSDWTWRTALSYEPSEDAMLYGGVSKGYRIGQVNPNRGPSPIDPSDVVIPESYEPDETFNYEIGAKTSWFDGRLVANLALFWIDWKNIQIDASRLSDRRNFVANAGK
ncbi:MAG TPA: TonB-dependent receptor, partial [Sphingomonadales bacterium]